MKTTILQNPCKSSFSVRPDRVITIIFAVALAISGIHHGFFEILQGNQPTNGFFIESIGEEFKRWTYGGDGAFTLIPNFLLTGVAAILTSLFIVWWSVFRLNKKYGTTIFLLLFVLLTLTGGGLGHIPFYLAVWLYSRNEEAKYKWWSKVLPGKIKSAISGTWLFSGFLSSLFFIAALEISVFGYVPGVSDPEKMLIVCWGFLFVSLVLMNYSYVSVYSTRNFVNFATGQL